MTDLLNQLRDADPVDRASLQVPPNLEARIAAGHGRARRSRRGPAVLTDLALAGAVVIAAMLASTATGACR